MCRGPPKKLRWVRGYTGASSEDCLQLGDGLCHRYVPMDEGEGIVAVEEAEPPLPAAWSAADVYAWACGCNLPDGVADQLLADEVDGETLLGLESKREVKESLGLPLGKADAFGCLCPTCPVLPALAAARDDTVCHLAATPGCRHLRAARPRRRPPPLRLPRAVPPHPRRCPALPRAGPRCPALTAAHARGAGSRMSRALRIALQPLDMRSRRSSCGAPAR